MDSNPTLRRKRNKTTSQDWNRDQVVGLQNYVSLQDVFGSHHSLLLPQLFSLWRNLPDMTRGSIGDGFRKLNVFLAVNGTARINLLGTAFLLTICTTLDGFPKPRILVWLAVFVLIAFAITLAILDC